MSWWRTLRERYSVSAGPLRTQRRLELVALSLCILVCLQLMFGFARLALLSGPRAIDPASDSLLVPAVVEPRMVSAQQRNDIITRPLFWVGRRPAEKVDALSEPDTGEHASKELDAVKLVGLFGAGDSAGVIVLVKNKKQRILQGEKVEGWTLQSVKPEKAVFVNGARREILALQRNPLDEPAVDTEANGRTADNKSSKKVVNGEAASLGLGPG